MKVSKNPTTVMTANGEVQTREEATVFVKQLNLLVKVMLFEETPAVLSLGKLCEDLGYTHHWTSGQKPHVTQNCKKINCNIANYVPFYVPGLATSSSTSSSPASSTSSSQETEHTNYEVNRCKMCRNGYRISRRTWSIRMFNHLNTLQALLMDCQWSREQKSYRARVSIVSFLTSRKTGIVTSARGRKLQGLLADSRAQSGKFW